MNNGPRAQIAFAFTMIPNLIVDVGATYSFFVTDPTNFILGLDEHGQLHLPVPQASPGEYQQPHRVAIITEYAFDALGLEGLKLRVGAEYTWGAYAQPRESVMTEYAPLTNIWVSPAYRVNQWLLIGSDLGLNIYGNELQSGRINKLGGTGYAFNLFGQFDIAANCYIRTGIAYSAGNTLGLSRMRPTEKDKVLTIPIVFHWGF